LTRFWAKVHRLGIDRVPHRHIHHPLKLNSRKAAIRSVRMDGRRRRTVFPLLA